MTDDTNPVDIDTDNLDEFEATFYGNPVATEVEEQEEAPEVDNLGEDDNPPAPEDEEPETEEVEEEEPEEEPKPKAKKSAKERIDELTAEKHEFRREAEAARKAAEALRKEFDDFRAAVEKKEPESKDIRDRLPDGAPDPDAKGEDGEPLYPLGEFDKNYIRDLTKFTIAEEQKVAKEEAAKVAAQEAYEKAQQEVNAQWAVKLTEAEKENPEIRQEITELVTAFDGLEPNYGAYLANTIMLSEVGPQIMSYLSQNIGEAQSIVASGPAAATLALGRLETRFLKTDKGDKSDKIVSKAPKPPEGQTRGQGGKFTVAPDTDNLDAFEEVFFQKK